MSWKRARERIRERERELREIPTFIEVYPDPDEFTQQIVRRLALYTDPVETRYMH